MMRGHALTLDTKRGDFYFEYVVKGDDLTNKTHNVVKFSKAANGSYVGTMLNSDPRLAQVKNILAPPWFLSKKRYPRPQSPLRSY